MKPLKTAALVLGVFLSLTGSVWAMIQVHAGTPHVDAVPRNEFKMLREVMQTEHRSLQLEISALKEALRK